MSPLSNLPLPIGAFLPLQRMSEISDADQLAYLNAAPFPHAFFDDFFDPSLLDVVLTEFPKPGAIKWQTFDNEKEIKLASSAESTFGPATRLLLYHLNSITFLEFLSKLTGIENLIPDPCFAGGGLHQSPRGGKLGIHADFNKHGRYGFDRRINVLLYLNKDWKEEYGGSLELWSRDMTKCEAKVLPIFNRMALFSTTSTSYHGLPDPLLCPEGMMRKSLALYYYTNGRPSEEASDSHSTLFRERGENDFRLTLRQKARRLANDLVPPIIARQFKGSTTLKAKQGGE